MEEEFEEELVVVEFPEDTPDCMLAPAEMMVEQLQ